MSAAPSVRRGVCFVIAAPSGAGKSSLTRALLAEQPGLTMSVSVTTRAPRAGEREGEHYFFRSEAAFDAMVRDHGLLEWAEVFGRRYGTPRVPVQQALSRGGDVVFDIDWQGHRHLRAALPGDVVSVFVLPPDLASLEHRLRARGDAPEEIARRMEAACSEMSHWREFDYVVVNDLFDRALAALTSILRAARLATSRQTGLAERLGGLGR